MDASPCHRGKANFFELDERGLQPFERLLVIAMLQQGECQEQRGVRATYAIGRLLEACTAGRNCLIAVAL
jgi:hypothetical protein